MEWSLFFFTGKWSEAPGDPYRLFREAARFADDNGFAAVWTPERHFDPFGGLYPTPSGMGAYLAGITRRVGIRAGSVVLPLQDPIRVAEEWSVVDNLSNGRAGVSFASGWHVNDFVLSPGSYATRRDIMVERIGIVRRLWRGESIRLPNGSGQETSVRIYPLPVQAEIPIWLTAQSAETFERAGATGANLLTNVNYQDASKLGERIALYRRSAAAAEPGRRGHVTLMVHTFIGSEKAVDELAKPAYAAYLLTNLDMQSQLARGLGLTIETTEEDRQFIVSRAVDRMIGRVGLIGTPEKCREQARIYRDLGVDEIACLIDFGIPEDHVLESLKNIVGLV
jgi:natural product biosynthesis luciferase-like monooxygenase protein